MTTHALLRGGALPVLKGVLLLGLLFLVGMLVLGLVLTGRGRVAMERSDALFHSGDLTGSTRAALDALLAYVPGSAHVQAAEARLLAIAQGAEAEGRLDVARAAWDALRLADEQTVYPGRGSLPLGDRARKALERLDRQEVDQGGLPAAP